ncbi:MAG TPA: hypothetical protein VEC59_06660 [Steroidobacteraceae bacterium]|nr:hypothetical protein [Steroidobacteraceae bacterium]
MRMHYFLAMIPALLVALAACEGMAPAADPAREEAALRADAEHGLAAAQTHDFERALMITVHRRQ